jgi:hypothetical protein
MWPVACIGRAESTLSKVKPHQRIHASLAHCVSLGLLNYDHRHSLITTAFRIIRFQSVLLQHSCQGRIIDFSPLQLLSTMDSPTNLKRSQSITAPASLMKKQRVARSSPLAEQPVPDDPNAPSQAIVENSRLCGDCQKSIWMRILKRKSREWAKAATENQFSH